VGRLAGRTYGAWPGALITFALINLTIGIGVIIQQTRQRRIERAEAAERVRRAEFLRRAQAQINR
jgi:hypothetical protein